MNYKEFQHHDGVQSQGAPFVRGGEGVGVTQVLRLVFRELKGKRGGLDLLGFKLLLALLLTMLIEGPIQNFTILLEVEELQAGVDAALVGSSQIVKAHG